MFELLKAAAAVGTATETTALPPDILRFILDYPGLPDVALERQRIAQLLGGSGFDLFAYSDEEPTLLILQFPGVKREQSPDYLFETADELVDALGLVSAEPEIGPSYADVETSDPTTEALGSILSALCRSHATPPDAALWPVRLVRADVAAQTFNVSGAGVLIGQPDTGVADHNELTAGIDMARGYDFLADRADPTDPLSRSMRSPGHGTGTASVAISRPAGQISGSAPGATVIPIRCVNSVVIGGGTAVAKAIDHARAQKCRIVSMSLGGPFAGRALRRAVARAVRDDMIVLAAAGNCVKMVTYPAWDRNVIAVAAVDERKRPWKGTCRGPEVDISAPGENVHIARREAVGAGHVPTPDEVSRVDKDGQGTSYAVALTAGVAALWIERFGFDAIRAEARQRGNLPVQELFRAALRATAQQGNGLDPEKMGAGIVDAQALLEMPLADITSGDALRPEAGPVISMAGSVSDMIRHGAEAEFVVFDRQMRADPEQGGVPETPFAAEPSPRLARLLRLPEVAPLSAPAALAMPATPPVPLSDALRRLGAGRGEGLEAAASISAEDALQRITSEGPGNILANVDSVLNDRRAKAPGVDGALQQEALNRMERALAKIIAADTLDAASEGEQRFALEALVRLTGRPAIRITDDDAELATNANLGVWAGHLMPNRAKWRPKVDAVGRIDVTDSAGRWVHGGTGFVLPGNRIMTNRHVLDVFAESLPGAGHDFRLRRRASIIFDPDAQDETRRFEITGIVSAGGARIGRRVDLAKLDMAILSVDPDTGHAPLPDPILLADTVSSTDPSIQNLLVVGYPARPGFSQAPRDAGNALRFWDRVGELYGDEFGVKYISPGAIMERPGGIANDARKWAFTHDATTLAGSSGSLILTLHGGMTACGLHFGGAPLTMNLAHDIAAVRAVGDGVFDAALL
ncbi:S8 family serine peptidase [Marivita sp. S0852]|uniref:S8 family serine peptidase n=1 Tax=Marivita sp. S0852 TaxID=3373893 RepID=UPI00398208CD